MSASRRLKRICCAAALGAALGAEAAEETSRSDFTPKGSAILEAALVHFNAAAASFDFGDYAGAERSARQALEMARTSPQRDFAFEGNILFVNAAVLHNLGYFRRAMDHHLEALASYEQAWKFPDKRLFNPIANVGSVLIEQREFAAARPHIERARQVHDANLGAMEDAERIYNAGYLAWLDGAVHLGEGEAAAARRLLREALAAFSQLSAPPRLTASMRAELARAEFALGNQKRAIELMEEAVQAYQSYTTPDDSYVRRATEDLRMMKASEEPPG